jgi:site-specific DNA-methyltransferase (adenine-specific)
MKQRSPLVLAGDMRAVLRAVPDASVDCIIADPPYGETSLGWDRRVPGWPSLVRRVLKPSGSMWVFGSQRMFLETAAEFEGWRLAQDVVWEKHNGAGFCSDRFRRVHENALQFYRADAPWSGVFKAPQYTSDATPRTVRNKARPSHWTGARGAGVYRSEDGGPRLMRSVIWARSEHGRALHPTQKPLSLVEPLLLYACPPGGHVLDPFAGSGTVGVLAQRHGLACTLVEADPEYAAIIERRLQDDAPLFREAAE